MKATLTVTAFSAKLQIPTIMEFPIPDGTTPAGAALNQSPQYVMNGAVLLSREYQSKHSPRSYDGTRISMPGDRRPTARHFKQFDAFVGPEIAVIRKTISRQNRLLMQEDDRRGWLYQKLEVYVSDETIDRMKFDLDGYLGSHTPMFWGSVFPGGPQHAWTESDWAVAWEASDERKAYEAEKDPSKKLDMLFSNMGA